MKNSPIKVTVHSRRKTVALAARDMGIDLGSVNTLVFVKGKGIVLREPSVIAIDNVTRGIVAVGKQAWEMVGRTPGQITTIQPLRDGVISDFEVTRKMLAHFIGRVSSRLVLGKPRVVITVPYGTTQVEKRAVMEAARLGGAREVFLVEEPLAAVLGAGLPAEEAVGNLVVNVGGGTTEVAVVALGGVVRGISHRTAGNALDQSIQFYLRRKHLLRVGERSAEIVKMEVGFACDPDPDLATYVKGISLASGLPCSMPVTATEVTRAMNHALKTIVQSIKNTYERTPPQLASDIAERGIILTGGGSQLRHLDRLITGETGLTARLAADPAECVAKGTGLILNSFRTSNRLELYHA